MKLENPELRDLMAARYVLGTLSANATRRFESLLYTDRQLQQVVDRWNDRFNRLGTLVQPVTPPDRVLPAIKRRLGLLGEQSQREPGRWLNRTAIFSLIASLCVIVVMVWVLIVQEPATTRPAQYVGILVSTGKTRQPAWLVEAWPRRNKLVVRAFTAKPVARDKEYELWVISPTRKTPVSLGLLRPTGRTELRISVANQRHFARAKLFAVSLEPRGGSPTGVPTGPVVYTGVVHAR